AERAGMRAGSPAGRLAAGAAGREGAGCRAVPCSSAASTSRRVTRPPGPVPSMLARLTPLSLATFRANGEAKVRSPEWRGGGVEGGGGRAPFPPGCAGAAAGDAGLDGEMVAVKAGAEDAGRGAPPPACCEAPEVALGAPLEVPAISPASA